MSWTRFFRRARWDDERARELDAHLSIEIDDNIARGMTPRDARDAARRKLGNITLVREDIYQMNTIALRRQRVARSQVWRAPPSPQSRLRHRRDPVAGARRRREHGDLPAAGCGAPSDAAGEGSAAAGRSPHCGYAERTHGRLPGAAADDDQSAVGTASRSSAGVLRCVRVGRQRLQSDDRRRGAVRAGLVGQRRFLQHAWCHAAAGPHPDRRTTTAVAARRPRP